MVKYEYFMPLVDTVYYLDSSELKRSRFTLHMSRAIVAGFGRQCKKHTCAIKSLTRTYCQNTTENV